MLGIQRLGGTFVGSIGHQLMPPMVAAAIERLRRASSLVYHHMLHRRALRHGLIHRRFQLHFRPAPVGSILRDHQRRLRVGNTIDKCVGRKSAENHRVRCSDARASQHGDGKGGAHPHVDGDAVALLNAQRLQNVGELTNLDQQLLISECLHFARFAFPNDGGLIAAMAGDVTVQAVVRQVDLAAGKPFGPRAIPIENAVPGLEPVQLRSDLRPELFGVGFRLFVEALIFFHPANVGLGAKFVGAFEYAIFGEYGVDIDLRGDGHSGYLSGTMLPLPHGRGSVTSTAPSRSRRKKNYATCRAAGRLARSSQTSATAASAAAE